MSGKVKLAIIGGGPGGYVAAIRAAQLGAEVTLIERDKLGGTCLNVGCIPTKALLHTATLYDEAKNGASCGVIANVSLDFKKAQEHKTAIVNKLVSGIGSLMKANKIKVITGDATFASRTSLTVKTATETENVTFEKAIIAVGSAPVKPPIPGIESKQCIDSTGALVLEAIPKSLVVVGGGVIGMEFACLYNTLGTKVTVVEMMDGILSTMDHELGKIVRTDLEKKGVTIHTGAKVLAVRDAGQEAAVKVALESGEEEILGEKVLISVGRKSVIGALGLDKVGVSTNERGWIKVNDKMETNVPNIYAIGDCNGQILLAHVASAQGEVASENACGHPAYFDGKTNPSCVYTSPEFAGVGLTEEQVKEQGIAYKVGKFPLIANSKAVIMEGGKGSIKVIAGAKHGEILGVHMVGARATDLIAEAALAIGLEATTEEIIATIHAHPTVAEAVREAVLAVDKRAIHIPNR